MNRSILGFVLALIAFTFSLCFVGVREAGARDFGGSFNFGGFGGSFSGEEGHDTTVVSLDLSSSVHRIGAVFTQFWTMSNDPSEGFGYMYINGFKDSAINTDGHSFWSDIEIGDSRLVQASSVDSAFGDDGDFNWGFGVIKVRPFDLRVGNLSYHEYPVEGEIGETFFYFAIYFEGSFGDGPEGDRLGAPFVPTPGTAGLVCLAGLCGFRRHRKMA